MGTDTMSTLTIEQIEEWRQSLLDGYQSPLADAESNVLCDAALAHVRAEAYFESVGVARWETSEVIMKLRELGRKS